MKTRSGLVERENKEISMRRQCELLSVCRGRLYYQPRSESDINLQIMELMDKHHLIHPAEGVKSIVYMLADKGIVANPKRIRRLRKLMGLDTIYTRKNLTKLGLAEYIKPYLLRHVEIDRPNKAWSIDITYIPMSKGFMYMVAVMDIYSRKILSWGISNSMEAKWCIDVVQQAVDNYGVPEIINSDQGGQFTSEIWSNTMEQLEIKISMDGKGRATDNTWIERFWKSLKYQFIYLNPSKDGEELYDGVQQYILHYNSRTHHTTKQKPNVRYKEAA